MVDISIAEYYSNYFSYPIIDVRSPGEYEKGHMANALNIPLFDNTERAHVGTVYKQEGKEQAVNVGYKYVIPKLTWFIEESQKAAPDKRVVVHCWRGGMRSHSFAEHLEKNGFENVAVLQKGYKAYRNHVLDCFERDVDLKVIGGYTGSGKTHILGKMKKLGCQIIDLEHLAHHKGSAFGAIGEEMQPTVEQFENNLFEQWRKLDLNKPIYIEDESHSIGSVKVPIPLYKKIRGSDVYFLDVPKHKRAKVLVDDYAGIDDAMLHQGILKISKRLGGLATKEALGALERKDYLKVADLTLNYYDKSYMRGVQKRNPDKIRKIELSDSNAEANAKLIKEIIEKGQFPNPQHETRNKQSYA